MITDSLQGNAMVSGVSTPVVADAAAKQASTARAQRPAVQAPAQQQDNFDLKSVKDAALKVEKFVSSVGSELNFSVDNDTGINIVKVLDSKTKEVIRQMPSREIIQLAQALDKVQGLLVRDKA